jgi:hypothetical protein
MTADFWHDFTDNCGSLLRRQAKPFGNSGDVLAIRASDFV